MHAVVVVINGDLCSMYSLYNTGHHWGMETCNWLYTPHIIKGRPYFRPSDFFVYQGEWPLHLRHVLGGR